MKENYWYLIILLTTLVACGGCGGGSGDSVTEPVTSITVSLSASNNEAEVGSLITLTWSSTNAQTCSATGDWSGSKAVSGNEEVNINKEGSNTFTLNCSASNATSGSASVQVTGVISRKEGTRGSIVEIYLLDPLEDSRNFCIDIVGSKANADIQSGLQAHTCYSYQGEISVDQGFDKQRISEQEFFMPSFEVCMTFNSTDNDLALSVCNGSEIQKFTFLTNGNIVVNSDPNLCVTVDQNDAREGGGGNPIHLIRDLQIEECQESLSIYQSWGTRLQFSM